MSSKYPVRRIVAWKEIFPTKLQKRNKDGKEKDKNNRYALFIDFYDLKCISYIKRLIQSQTITTNLNILVTQVFDAS